MASFFIIDPFFFGLSLLPGQSSDPDCQYTTSLLHFDGADLSTTFTDEFGHVWTANGDAKLRTNQKIFGTASLNLDGTGDYISTPHNEAFDFGSGDFTVDCWVRLSAYSPGEGGAYAASVYSKQDDDSTRAIVINIVGTASSWDTLQISLSPDGTLGSKVDIAGSYSFLLSTWYHIAARRVGNQVQLLVNGTVVGQGTYASSIYSNTTDVRVGQVLNDAYGTFFHFPGFIDEMRITKGVARSFGGASVPGFEFGNQAGDPDWDNVASLLKFNGTHGSTTFTDETGKTWTRTGDTSTIISTAKSKFGGSSLFLDGTDGRLNSSDHADFAFGADDFTVECWFNASSLTGAGVFRGLVSKRQNFDDNISWWFGLTENNNGLIAGISTDGTTLNRNVNARVTLATDTWYHAAFCRNGDQLQIYLDGKMVGAAKLEDGDSANAGTSDVVIGCFEVNPAATNTFDGYIDDVRITKGVGRYCASFAPPAVGFRTGAGDPAYDLVGSLLHFNGSDGSTTFTDETGKTWSAFGNAQLDTAQKKFGSASGLFDGAGDYIETPNHTDFDFGAGDFTAEAWVYLSAHTATSRAIAGVYDTASNRAWVITINPSNLLSAAVSLDGLGGGPQITAQEVFPTGQWVHVALVREGGFLTLWQDQVVIGRVNAVGSLFASTATLRVGALESAGPAAFFDGWIDDFRITKGYAHYTKAYCTPTSPTDCSSGSVDANCDKVVSLLNFNGSDGSTTFTDQKGKVWTANGDAQLDTAQKKFGSASLLLDGTGDYITTPDHTDFEFGAGAFTIEGWVRLNTTGVGQIIIGKRAHSDNFEGFSLLVNSSNFLRFVTKGNGVSWGVSLTGTTALSAAQWYHVAAVRDGDVYTIYLNGVEEDTVTVSGAIDPVATAVHLGANVAGTPSALSGWIDDFRITKGYAHYTEDFAVPSREFNCTES